MTAAGDPADIVRAYHLAIDRLAFEAIAGFFAEDALYISNGVGRLQGRAAIMATFRAYFAEFSDQANEDESLEAVSPCEVRSVWRLTATSMKTGQRTERHGVETVSLDAAGRIIRVDVVDG